jgi:hypothetical protein
MATSLVEARPDHAPFVARVVMTAFRSHLERGMPALQKGVAEADERLGRTPEQTAAGLQRISPVFSVTPDHEPRAWIIEKVATHPRLSPTRAPGRADGRHPRTGGGRTAPCSPTSRS